MAPQAAPHRRGGTHRVKDEDKANTVFDQYDYKQLKSECIARGVYIKDMKKKEMAQTLAKNEQEKKRAENEAIAQRQRKQQQLEREKREENDRRLKADAERHRKRIARQARRDRDESVSDETPDEEELHLMHEMFGENGDSGYQDPVGQALSEESWDSTSTETSICYTRATIHPGCKLRLFEWTWPELPSTLPLLEPTPRSVVIWMTGTPISPRFDIPSSSPTPSPVSSPASSFSSHSTHSPTAVHEPPLLVPHNVPYAPLKVHTTGTLEKLFLPGQTYPPGVDPDYVPILSQRICHAARNGILEGVLRKATIEPAVSWIDRTLIQGWNARIFFTLPPRNETKRLAEVYTKWYLENRKLLRVEPRGEGLKITRAQRHAQRHRNKAKQVAEVLDASKYRPTAVCYLPAYLDFDTDKSEPEDDMQQQERTLDNLFYIRFPGCDVPHYYFWTHPNEWADPTLPNPDWTPDMAEHETTSKMNLMNHPKLSSKRLPDPPQEPIRKAFVRIKNPIKLPHPPPSSPLTLLNATVSRIEDELYHHGLSATLATYRIKWLANGKSRAWEVFSRALTWLYPSGALPSVPPVQANNPESIALKLASIEVDGEDMSPSPLVGDEPWTSRDDVWWHVSGVEVDSRKEATQEVDEVDTEDLQGLCRRVSVQSIGFGACEAWLEGIDGVGEMVEMENWTEGVRLDEEGMERKEWEDGILQKEWGSRFVRDSQYGVEFTCPVCLLEMGGMSDEVSLYRHGFPGWDDRLTTIQEQAEHMHSHSVGRRTSSDSRNFSFGNPFVALPPAARRPSCRLFASFDDSSDSGADADDEKTLTKKRRRSGFNEETRETKKHCIREQHCALYDMPGAVSPRRF
jgi:hypothetical protein